MVPRYIFKAAFTAGNVDWVQAPPSPNPERKNVMKKTGSLLTCAAMLLASAAMAAPQHAAASVDHPLFAAVESRGDTTDPIVGNMRFVPAGSFTQGSPSSEACRASNETQFVHTLTKDMMVMETEVTRDMWADLKAVQPGLPKDPTDTSQGSGDSNPVQNITWYEAVLFANLLSHQNGYAKAYYKDAGFTEAVNADNYASGDIYCKYDADGYRLPTEGEWEYFARAGTTGAFLVNEPGYDASTCGSCTPGTFPNLESVAWFCASGGNATHPVGRKVANAWGLRDVHGNVWEWCWDWWGVYPGGSQTDYRGAETGIIRVARGGGWGNLPSHCRLANRGSGGPDQRNTAIGFRLLRSGSGTAPNWYHYMIPAAAHAAGAAGTNWKTDVAVLNKGASRADFSIILMKRSTDNSSSPAIYNSFVDGHKIIGFNDILMGTFNFSGVGALVIDGPSADLMITSRTYNDVSGGTYGQFIPGFAESELLTAGQTATMMQLHQTSGYRTNIGFASLTNAQISLTITLYDNNGTNLGAVSQTLEPYGCAQVDRIFLQVTNSDVVNGYAEVISTSTGARYMAYASVVDNKSGDPVFMPAQR